MPDPEARSGAEGSRSSITPPTGRGSERFNWKMAAICVVGSQIGGAILERAALVAAADNIEYGTAKAIGMLAFVAGEVIFGLVIPIEIYNKATHTTWRDRWNKLIS